MIAAVAAMAALGLAGCWKTAAGPDKPEDGLVEIRIIGGGNRTPAAFSIHATAPGGTSVSACCSGGAASAGAASAIVPRSDGCAIATEADSLDIVIKAPGFHTARYAYSRRASGGKPFRAELRPLGGFFASEDYVTGFPAAGGLESFAAMAVKGSGESGATATIKFFIDRFDGDPEVYFLNSVRHPLHYIFVRDVLGRPVPLDEFEARTYHGLDRTGVAGTLVWRTGFAAAGAGASEGFAAPMTVEFFPSDDLTPEQALKACLLVEERIQFPEACGGKDRVAYLPPTAAHESALAARADAFTAAGMRWITREALYGGAAMQLLNPGEAYGTLRLLPPGDLIAAPVSFRDIVILPRLPNEMPLVGGSITEEMQTPLSHVNVAARGRRTPNLALPGASTRPEVAALIDSLVRFEVAADTFILEKATREEAEAFWSALHPEPPAIPAADLARGALEPFSNLAFDDRTRIGVKAANLAELFRLLGGAHAPDGFAVPFARYADFLAHGRMDPEACSGAMADCREENRAAALCAEAADLRAPFCASGSTLDTLLDTLLADSRFQSDSPFREASLDGFRYLMRHIPVDSAFARELDRYADSLFHGKRIRLRSSTNAEDLEDFNGAGLYSSTGADAGGPEAPSAEIRKVWASVWNWQAYEERSFRRIDHRKVCMGVAVHPAFSAEEANGVLITRNLADPGIDGFYVNVQPGETSVTNPENGALPEVFTIAWGATVIRQRYSSLSPERAVLSDAEIRGLADLAARAHNRFAALHGKDPRDPAFALDLEFKLDDPGRSLFIKQARPFGR